MLTPPTASAGEGCECKLPAFEAFPRYHTIEGPGGIAPGPLHLKGQLEDALEAEARSGSGPREPALAEEARQRRPGIHRSGLRALRPSQAPLGEARQHGLCPGLASDSRELDDLHQRCILIQMRTTLNLDEKLLARATCLSGIREKTALLHAGLEALIARESARRLAALGGTERKLGPVPRRRSRVA